MGMTMCRRFIITGMNRICDGAEVSDELPLFWYSMGVCVSYFRFDILFRSVRGMFQRHRALAPTRTQRTLSSVMDVPLLCVQRNRFRTRLEKTSSSAQCVAKRRRSLGDSFWNIPRPTLFSGLIKNLKNIDMQQGMSRMEEMKNYDRRSTCS